MTNLNLISKGDTVYLGFNGAVAVFKVQRVNAGYVWLSYHVENVAHIRRVEYSRVLQLLKKAA